MRISAIALRSGCAFSTARVCLQQPQPSAADLHDQLLSLLNKPHATHLDCSHLAPQPASSSVMGKLFTSASTMGNSPPIPLILTESDDTEPVPLPLPKPLPPVALRSLTSGAAAMNVASPSAPKNTLVLDIDETLLHTSFRGGPNHVPLSEEAIEALQASEVENAGRIGGAQSLIRPGLSEFLRETSDLFEVVFWTAGTSGYCAAVVNALERYVVGTHRVSYMFDPAYLRHFSPADLPPDVRFKHVNYYALSRNQCLTGGPFQYLKYLPLLGRPLNRSILIDDHPRSFRYTPRNAVKIDRFVGAPDDTALIDMLPMLRKAASSDDVMVELDHWRPNHYEQLDDFTQPNTLLGDYQRARRAAPIQPFADHPNNEGIRKQIAEHLARSEKA